MLDRTARARLHRFIRSEVAGFGGDSDETTTALMSWIKRGVRRWEDAERKRAARKPRKARR